MATDMERVRTVLLFGLGVLEHSLDALTRARERTTMRRFQTEHPEVTFYPDGERQ